MVRREVNLLNPQAIGTTKTEVRVIQLFNNDNLIWDSHVGQPCDATQEEATLPELTGEITLIGAVALVEVPHRSTNLTFTRESDDETRYGEH